MLGVSEQSYYRYQDEEYLNRYLDQLRKARVPE